MTPDIIFYICITLLAIPIVFMIIMLFTTRNKPNRYETLMLMHPSNKKVQDRMFPKEGTEAYKKQQAKFKEINNKYLD